MKDAFAKTGKILTDKEIKAILDKHSIIDNGGLNFDEFKLVFFNDEENDILSPNQNKSNIKT